MTGPEPITPPTQPPPDNLTARVFRALYQDVDLHTIAGTHIAVPKGTLCFTAACLGEIARQISDHEHHALPHLDQAPHLNAADVLPDRGSLAIRIEKPMHPPDPFPASPPGANPARAAADLNRALTDQGITGIYTATTAKLAVISITADLTVWTNGHQFWCTHHGQWITSA